MRKILSLFAAVLFAGSMMATVESGTTYSTPSASGVPTGWECSDGGGSSYVKLTANTHYIQTNEFCVSSFTSVTVKARKFGGPSDAQALITVSWWVESTETVLGTIAPTSTSLTDYTISSPASVTANTEGYIKISCKGAGSSKGSGVSEVTITYDEGSCGGSTPTCKTPTFSLEAGTYEGTQSVTITSTAGATIYYTTDGTTPTETSSVYSAPIAVTESMTLKAYAVKDGYDDSEVAEVAYVITEGPDVTIAFEGNTNWDIPFGSGNKTVAEGTYTDGTYTIKIAGSTGEGYYINGYLLLGKTGAYVELPKFSNPIEKIVVGGTSGGSTGVKFNVYDGTTAVSTEVTGCKNVDQEFVIDNPAANKAYKIQVTSNANLQIAEIKIFYGAAPAVAKPTISGEASFEDEVEVTISAAAGAAIYYTLDGTDPTDASTEYTAAFTLNATTTVKAIAKIGSDVSAVAEKTFTKLEKQTCADVYDLNKNDEVSLNNVTVTYVSGTNVWVKDATGAMLLYLTADATWSAGDVLAGVHGTVDVYKGLYEVKPSAAQVAAVTATAGAAPAPEVLTAVTESDMNKYIIIKGASVTEFVSKNATLTIGDDDYVLYDKFNSGFEFNTEKKYDVVALVSMYNTLQLNFVSAEVSTTTAIDNNVVEGKAVKSIENGMLVIEKNGVRYNVMGQIIK